MNSDSVRTARWSMSLAALLVLVLPPPAPAAKGDCSQPVSNGDGPNASDCLRILQVAVGTTSCSPACLCAPKSGSTAAASDALICLKKAVGQGVTLACGCSWVRVHYPAGGHSIDFHLASGSVASAQATATSCSEPQPDLWICNLGQTGQGLTGKPRLDATVEAKGAEWIVKAPGSIDVWPFFQSTHGELQILGNVESQKLGLARDVAVYLPAGYGENTLKRYPILFMQDGQNLFDASQAFGGVEWEVDETVDALSVNGNIVQPIVVAPYAAADRLDAYSPTRDPDLDAGGDADLYLDFLLEELTPSIVSNYRVDPTAKPLIAGSSLGALASVYGGWTRWPQFSGLAALSPALYWDGAYVNGLVAADDTDHAGLRVYLDMGTAEPSSSVDLVNDLAATLVAKGWQQGNDLDLVLAPGQVHNEAAWQARFPGVLAFLLGDPDRVSP